MTYHHFTNEHGEEYGSFRVYYMTSWDIEEGFSYDSFLDEYERDYGMVKEEFAEEVRQEYLEELRSKVGWYWQVGFPGCMPDGEPMGPFDTEENAIEAANDR